MEENDALKLLEEDQKQKTAVELHEQYLQFKEKTENIIKKTKKNQQKKHKLNGEISAVIFNNNKPTRHASSFILFGLKMVRYLQPLTRRMEWSSFLRIQNNIKVVRRLRVLTPQFKGLFRCQKTHQHSQIGTEKAEHTFLSQIYRY